MDFRQRLATQIGELIINILELTTTNETLQAKVKELEADRQEAADTPTS